MEGLISQGGLYIFVRGLGRAQTEGLISEGAYNQNRKALRSKL